MTEVSALLTNELNVIPNLFRDLAKRIPKILNQVQDDKKIEE